MAKRTKPSSKPHGTSSEDNEKSGKIRGRPMWSGSVSFGLINIPIKLYPAIRPKDVRFHLLHAKDKSRLEQKLVCPVDEKEVPRTEAVKGYEFDRGRQVVVTQEELDALMPKATRTVELISVVDIKEIDPIYFERPFYMVPDERAAKAYLLLVEALRESKKAALAKFVMRNKEYIGAIRPVKDVLCMDTLHFANEIVTADDLGWKAPSIQLKDAEIKMALQFMESMTAKFEPKELHDEFRDAVMDLVQKKVEGKEVVAEPEPEEEAPQVIDLMEALKRSVAQVQKKRRAA